MMQPIDLHDTINLVFVFGGCGLVHEKSGLGTGIVKVLSNQLDARVETLTGPEGTTVSITHATSADSALPRESGRMEFSGITT
jgi:hypothetical protein